MHGLRQCLTDVPNAALNEVVFQTSFESKNLVAVATLGAMLARLMLSAIGIPPDAYGLSARRAYQVGAASVLRFEVFKVKTAFHGYVGVKCRTFAHLRV